MFSASLIKKFTNILSVRTVAYDYSGCNYVNLQRLSIIISLYRRDLQPRQIHLFEAG